MRKPRIANAAKAKTRFNVDVFEGALATLRVSIETRHLLHR